MDSNGAVTLLGYIPTQSRSAGSLLRYPPSQRLPAERSSEPFPSACNLQDHAGFLLLLNPHHALETTSQSHSRPAVFGTGTPPFARNRSLADPPNYLRREKPYDKSVCTLNNTANSAPAAYLLTVSLQPPLLL